MVTHVKTLVDTPSLNFLNAGIKAKKKSQTLSFFLSFFFKLFIFLFV